MMDTRERNAEIVRLHAEGRSISDLAAIYRISNSNVGMILCAARAAAGREAQGEAVRQAMRSADDLDRQWPLDDVLAAFGLRTRTATAVTGYFTGKGREAASLMELLDFVAPELRPGRAHEWPPVLMERGVGKKTFRAILDALRQSRIGGRFEAERRRRWDAWDPWFPGAFRDDRRPLHSFDRDLPARQPLE